MSFYRNKINYKEILHFYLRDKTTQNKPLPLILFYHELPLEKKFERVGIGFPTLWVDTGCASVSTALGGGGGGERFKPSGVPTGEGAFSRFSNSIVFASWKMKFHRN